MFLTEEGNLLSRRGTVFSNTFGAGGFRTLYTGADLLGASNLHKKVSVFHGVVVPTGIHPKNYASQWPLSGTNYPGKTNRNRRIYRRAAPPRPPRRIQRASNFRPSLLNFFHTEFRFASEMLVPSISDRSLRPVHSAYLSSPSPRKINSSDRRDYDSISSTEHWRTSNFRPQFPSSGSADERGLYPIWKPKHVPGTCYVLPFLFFPPSLSSVLREFKRAKTRLRFVDNYQLRPDTCVTRDTVTDNDPL